MWICRCCCHGAFKHFVLSNFYAPTDDSKILIHFTNQNIMSLPLTSRLWLQICSPRFSAWLINKCPHNFAQLVSHSSYRLKEEKKTYSILMHIRENSDTSSGGIDHSQSPLQRCMPMTSIIRPHGCWLMHSRQALLSSTPLRAAQTTPLHHLPALLSRFPVLPLSFGTSPISIPLPFSPRHPLPHSFPPSLPPRFPYFPVPSSSPPVIRSWWPPAGVNGGENQPWVSGCISSLRCSPASNEDGHCQNSASCCARHTWGHNEQCG